MTHLIPISATVCAGLVYITDSGSNQVLIFKTTGEYVAKFGEGTLSRPECITVDDNGFVYVTDSRSKIVKF